MIRARRHWRSRVARASAIALACLVSTALLAQPRIDAPIADRAVLQRGEPIVLTGTASPGEAVVISLAGRQLNATAGADGRFTAQLPALEAGGPYDLIIAAPSGTIVLSDILIGDVFLCSGQSNMEMTVGDSQRMIPAVFEAADPSLRLLAIAHATAITPQQRFAEQPKWVAAGYESAQRFSAACFFMAQALRKAVGVPIGVIHASWGGSRISAWMSDDALNAGGLSHQAQLLAEYRRDPRGANQRFAALWETWWRENNPDGVDNQPWAGVGSQPWKPVPSWSNFESWGVPALADYNGMVWFRRTLSLSAKQAAGAATLAIGRVDDADRTWVNGIGVGGSSLAGQPRSYFLPAGTLKPGVNTITVNVDDVYANGGMLGPAEAMRIGFADGSSIALDSGWDYAIAKPITAAAPREPWSDINGAGTLFNAMIAPLGSTRLAGIAWYQGEADTGLPGYDRRLKALIEDWRRRFGTPRTGFAVAQLSAYGDPLSSPSESGWGSVRDAQRRVVAQDPHAGLAVTHDIGDFTDIHPGQKYQLGLRLARAMLAARYGQHASPAGPAIDRAVRDGQGAITLHFTGVTGALHARNANVAIGFELCAERPDSCRFTTGRVAQDRVILADDGKPVTRIRYAWGDAPHTNLTDDAQLPVATFEIALR